MMRKFVLGAAVVVACVGVVACGSDDKKLSKADIGKKATEICAKTNKKSDAIDAPANLRQNPVAAAAFFSKIEPIVNEQIGELGKLKPADDVKGAWTQFVARMRQAHDTLVVVRDKAKAEDQSGLADLAKLARIAKKIAPEAAAVNAPKCAE